MKEGCVQQPALGETLKIDFDLFPTAATLVLSTSSPAQTEIQTEIVTLTSTPRYPPPSPAAMSASSASAVAASPAAAAVKSSHDKNVRVGVGVGAGVGGALAIATVAVTISLILARRRSAQRIEFEQDARARWEAEYHAGMEQKPIRNGQRWELGSTAGDKDLVEADDGSPNELPMLDNNTVASNVFEQWRH